MIIIKFLILLTIFGASTSIGFLLSRKYKNRVIELNKIRNALLMFKSKIEFTYEPITNIFGDISKIIYLDEKNIFNETIKKNKEIYGAWNDSIDEVKNNLSKEDKDIIKMFGKMLGKTDIKGQVSEIVLTQSLIEKQIENAEKEREKNVKLYKTMGIVSGIGICIILV